MAICIISAKQFAKKLKATIQLTGRLGFTDETAKTLGFQSGKFARFAQDDENGVLYLIINNEASDDAFPLKLSSKYYFIETRQMFDMLGYDYKNQNIMFDLVRKPSLDDVLQGQVYFMKQRINPRKEKTNEDLISDT